MCVGKGHLLCICHLSIARRHNRGYLPCCGARLVLGRQHQAHAAGSPRPFALLTAFALLGCNPADAPHPGTIAYKRNGVVQHVERAVDVPEQMRFYAYDQAWAASHPGRPRRVPVIEVDANDMGPGQMEVLEYGPGHELLRTTMGFTGRTGR